MPWPPNSGSRASAPAGRARDRVPSPPAGHRQRGLAPVRLQRRLRRLALRLIDGQCPIGTFVPARRRGCAFSKRLISPPRLASADQRVGIHERFVAWLAGSWLLLSSALGGLTVNAGGVAADESTTLAFAGKSAGSMTKVEGVDDLGGLVQEGIPRGLVLGLDVDEQRSIGGETRG